MNNLAEAAATPSPSGEQTPPLATAAPSFAAVRLSLAQIGLILVLLAAGASRFANLGRIPLAPAEAQAALHAWQPWQAGVSDPLQPASPAYATLTTLLMAVVGDSDATARLIPALFGLALVFLPWLLRQRIGVWGALTASLALAISPLGTSAARTADGAALALFAAMLLVLSRLRFLEKAERPWFYALWVALGLGLVSAPLFYSALIGIMLAWVAQATLGPALVETTPYPERAVIRQGALITVGIVLALGTFFFWNPAGLGSVGNILGQWLGQFDFRTNLLNWATPILVLARYEPIPFFFGLTAVIWALWRGQPLPSFLAYWLVGALVTALLQPGNLANGLLLTLPGSLLCGAFVNHLLQQTGEWWDAHTGRLKWALAFFLLVIMAAGIASLARHMQIIRITPDDFYNLWIAVTLLSFAVAVVSYLWVWDKVIVRQGVAMGLLIFLVVFSWGSSWWLNQTAANDTRTGWVTQASDDELPLLIRTIEEFSEQRKQARYDLHIFSAVDTPVLRWYLRRFPQLEVGASVPASAVYDAILTANEPEQTFGADYVGSDFGLLRPDTPQTFDAVSAARGLLFREFSAPVNETRVILWLRADLVR